MIIDHGTEKNIKYNIKSCSRYSRALISQISVPLISWIVNTSFELINSRPFTVKMGDNDSIASISEEFYARPSTSIWRGDNHLFFEGCLANETSKPCHLILNTSTARKRQAVLRREACQRRRHGKFATNRNCCWAGRVCVLATRRILQ